ncbi:MAG: acyl-CoA thioesterase [Myxococcota bacterium]
MPGFAEIATTTKEEEGLYVGSLDETWLQGPGAFGGVTFGVMLDAMRRELGDRGRPVRSMTAELSAPLRPEAFAIEARSIREGGSVTSMFAEVTQDSGSVAAALATFGEKRDDPIDFERTARPDVPPHDDLEAVQSGLMPAFAQHFEYRFCVGYPPFSGADEAHLGGWLRPKVPMKLDARLAAALLDAYPPAIFACLSQMRPVSTVQMSASFVQDYLHDADYAPDAHYLVEKKADVASDGYCEEQQRVWGPDGRLVALGRQMMVIIR